MCAHACMLTITVATPSASVSRRQFDAVNDIALRVMSPTAATVSRAVCLSYCLRAYSRQHTCNPFKRIYTYICVLLIGLIMHIIFRLHGTDSSVAHMPLDTTACCVPKISDSLCPPSPWVIVENSTTWSIKYKITRYTSTRYLWRKASDRGISVIVRAWGYTVR